MPSSEKPGQVRPRFREAFPELKADLGFYEPGPANAITDVTGVTVGHATIVDGVNHLHSGVTAIWPRADVYDFRPRASGFVLHGAGEMTGLTQILEWGVLETPILLTSTLNVGKVHDAVIEYLAEKHPQMGLKQEVLIPVVAECDDSHLSRARERPVGREHVRRALDGAQGGAVAEGGVGAGTGMIAFDFKGGIGTSSRIVQVGATRRVASESAGALAPDTQDGVLREFRVGALINANVGMRRQLRVAGRLLGKDLIDVALPEPRESSLAGTRPERSIIVVLATDAPLRPDQLRRLSVRAGLALGRSGSFAGHQSGEIVVAFSTSLGEPRDPAGPCQMVENLHDSFLNPLYEATVECVEECLLNALMAGKYMEGRNGHLVFGMPVDELKKSLLGRG